jgi:nitrate reductase cytochrome c-type subunit
MEPTQEQKWRSATLPIANSTSLSKPAYQTNPPDQPRLTRILTFTLTLDPNQLLACHGVYLPRQCIAQV